MDIHLFFSDAKKEKRLVLTVNFFFYHIWVILFSSSSLGKDVGMS